MRSDTEKQYDPEQDPDTDAPATPDEVEGGAERDQAEGDQEGSGGEAEGDGG